MKKDKKYRLGFTEQARKIVDSLTLEQKVSLMGGNMTMQEMIALMSSMMDPSAGEEHHYNDVPYAAGGIPEKDIPPMLFCDGPRGVVCGNRQSTCFPVSMLRGATFDPALEEEVGHAIGREVRAFGGNLFAGVCINMPYHPGWGRSQESYGEETFALGQMGSALVRGVQSEDVMACVKHYAFNQMENARFKVSVTCDQRTEKEVFLPHFKDCVDAGAASIMSSYNRYNGVQCGHSHYLLTEVLKGDWDFDGFVMSDFVWGVKDTVEAANGGQDMEMCLTQFFGDKLVKAVQDGFVPEARVNDAALRIVRTILAFDKDHKEYDMSVVGCPEHIALARRVAEEGVTLVKNEGVLPLKGPAKIAVLGKLGAVGNIGDHGSSQVRPAYIVTLEEGLRKRYPDAEIDVLDGSDLEAARAAAQAADAVLFAVGYNHDDEGEYVAADESQNYTGSIGGDRKVSTGLHDDDIRLIREVGPVNPNSTAILYGGNTILMAEWIDCVNAVIMAYYPGQEGGNVLAEILAGDVNPSGKLPFVVPKSEDDLPRVDWEATDQYYEYYHGYTRLDKKGIAPLFPYGFGLSYTQFQVSEPEFCIDGDELVARCRLANVGERDGKEVVQLYVGFENSAVDRPVRQLRGFRKVAVPAGEAREVEIRCPLEKLKYYDPVTRQWILEKTDCRVCIGTSEAGDDLLCGIVRMD